MYGIIKCYIDIQRNYGMLGNQSFLSIFFFSLYIKLGVVVIIGIFLLTFWAWNHLLTLSFTNSPTGLLYIINMLSHFLLTILTDMGQKLISPPLHLP